MKATALFLILFAAFQMKKNDPNGIWQSQSGTQYELHLDGSDLKVKLVPGSSKTYLEYEVDLKNTEEVNTYKGAGHLVARLQNKKECRFDTEWQMIVVSANEIIGSTTNIVPDPETCELKEKGSVQLDLKKK